MFRHGLRVHAQAPRPGVTGPVGGAAGPSCSASLRPEHGGRVWAHCLLLGPQEHRGPGAHSPGAPGPTGPLPAETPKLASRWAHRGWPDSPSAAGAPGPDLRPQSLVASLVAEWPHFFPRVSAARPCKEHERPATLVLPAHSLRHRNTRDAVRTREHFQNEMRAGNPAVGGRGTWGGAATQRPALQGPR